MAQPVSRGHAPKRGALDSRNAVVGQITEGGAFDKQSMWAQRAFNGTLVTSHF